MLTNKVTINLNVLCSLMTNSVMGNLNSTMVITIEGGRRRLRNAEVREKTTKPDNFSNSMSHSTRNIVSSFKFHIKLNGGISNLSISKTSTVNNFISILGLRQKVALGRKSHLNTKRVLQWDQILHFEG
ncbi:hypothetical protein CsSME_00031420 [Camellia sinensis var. sinensis]